jgi:hypothetical protein
MTGASQALQHAALLKGQPVTVQVWPIVHCQAQTGRCTAPRLSWKQLGKFHMLFSTRSGCSHWFDLAMLDTPGLCQSSASRKHRSQATQLRPGASAPLLRARPRATPSTEKQRHMRAAKKDFTPRRSAPCAPWTPSGCPAWRAPRPPAGAGCWRPSRSGAPPARGAARSARRRPAG